MPVLHLNELLHPSSSNTGLPRHQAHSLVHWCTEPALVLRTSDTAQPHFGADCQRPCTVHCGDLGGLPQQATAGTHTTQPATPMSCIPYPANTQYPCMPPAWTAWTSQHTTLHYSTLPPASQHPTPQRHTCSCTQTAQKAPHIHLKCTSAAGACVR